MSSRQPATVRRRVGRASREDGRRRTRRKKMEKEASFQPSWMRGTAGVRGRRLRCVKKTNKKPKKILRLFLWPLAAWLLCLRLPCLSLVVAVTGTSCKKMLVLALAAKHFHEICLLIHIAKRVRQAWKMLRSWRQTSGSSVHPWHKWPPVVIMTFVFYKRLNVSNIMTHEQQQEPTPAGNTPPPRCFEASRAGLIWPHPGCGCFICRQLHPNTPVCLWVRPCEFQWCPAVF